MLFAATGKGQKRRATQSPTAHPHTPAHAHKTTTKKNGSLIEARCNRSVVSFSTYFYRFRDLTPPFPPRSVRRSLPPHVSLFQCVGHTLLSCFLFCSFFLYFIPISLRKKIKQQVLNNTLLFVSPAFFDVVSSPQRSPTPPPPPHPSTHTHTHTRSHVSC